MERQEMAQQQQQLNGGSATEDMQRALKEKTDLIEMLLAERVKLLQTKEELDTPPPPTPAMRM